MFVIFLEFSDNRGQAAEWMEVHNRWIQQGFDDGVFLLVGGLQPNRGGAIIAHNATSSDLQRRVESDPFVAEGVVTAEIHEIAAKRTDERLAFLVG